MGINELAAASPAALDRLFPLAFGTRAAPPAAGESASPPAAETAPRGSSHAAFEAITYRRSVSASALLAQFQQAAASPEGATEAGEQLTFAFFSASRTEELTLFRARSAALAEGLEGQQQQRFVQASERLSVRFSLSLEVTGASLAGFSGAAEAGAGNPNFDKLMDFFDDALSKASEILDKMLETLGGFFSGSEDFEETLDAFLRQVLEDAFGTPALPAGPEPSAATPGQTTQAEFFGMQVQMEFSFEMTATAEAQVKQSDPIVLDLDGDGIELTSYARGAQFDILGSGRAVQTAFVTGGDAFLALDRNGNGVIDDGTELFGDQRGAANGFEELRKLDSNRDGVIDRRDERFGDLRLFRDNGNGITEPGELLTLEEAGVTAISLDYRNVQEIAAGGNTIAQTAWYQRSDGSTGRAADAILNYIA